MSESRYAYTLKYVDAYRAASTVGAFACKPFAISRDIAGCVAQHFEDEAPFFKDDAKRKNFEMQARLVNQVLSTADHPDSIRLLVSAKGDATRAEWWRWMTKQGYTPIIQPAPAPSQYIADAFGSIVVYGALGLVVLAFLLAIVRGLTGGSGPSYPPVHYEYERDPFDGTAGGRR